MAVQAAQGLVGPRLHPVRDGYEANGKRLSCTSAFPAHRFVCVQVFPVPTTLAGDRDAAAMDTKQRIAAVRYTWPGNVEVDQSLKDLVDRMLVLDPLERYAMTIVPEPERNEQPEDQKDQQPKSKEKKPEQPPPTDHINTEIRVHPFMARFPWGAMTDRTMIVSQVLSQ